MKRPFGGAAYVIPDPDFGQYNKYAILCPVADGRHPPLCKGIPTKEAAEYIAAALNATPEIPDTPQPPREVGFYRCLEVFEPRKKKGAQSKPPKREIWGIWYWNGKHWLDPTQVGFNDPDHYDDGDFAVIEQRISELP